MQVHRDAPIFRNGGEEKNVVQIEVEGGVDVINQRIDILFRAMVERNDGECRASTTMRLEVPLVIFDRFEAVARGGDDNRGAAREETYTISTPIEPFPAHSCL